MTEKLYQLQDLMHKGTRIFREDLPEDLRELEECLSLHSPEYAVKYSILEEEIKNLRSRLNTQQQKNTELVFLYTDAARFIVDSVESNRILFSDTPNNAASLVYNRCMLSVENAVSDLETQKKIEAVQEYLAWKNDQPKNTDPSEFFEHIRQNVKSMRLLNKKHLEKTIYEWCKSGATANYLKAKVDGHYINVAVQNSATKETIALQWAYTDAEQADET